MNQTLREGVYHAHSAADPDKGKHTYYVCTECIAVSYDDCSIK